MHDLVLINRALFLAVAEGLLLVKVENHKVSNLGQVNQFVVSPQKIEFLGACEPDPFDYLKRRLFLARRLILDYSDAPLLYQILLLDVNHVREGTERPRHICLLVSAALVRLFCLDKSVTLHIVQEVQQIVLAKLFIVELMVSLNKLAAVRARIADLFPYRLLGQGSSLE